MTTTQTTDTTEGQTMTTQQYIDDNAITSTQGELMLIDEDIPSDIREDLVSRLGRVRHAATCDFWPLDRSDLSPQALAGGTAARRPL